MLGRGPWVKIHRWIGLTMAFFLIVVGLTGALLAFYSELDAVFAPELYKVTPPSPEAGRLDPFSLNEAARRAHPEADLNWVELWPQQELRSVRFRVEALMDPATRTRPQLPYSEFYLDPVTGKALGDRRWGDISQGSKNLIPFLEELHTSLALGVVGSYWFGIVALLWTVDCFIGAYLTFPLRRASIASGASHSSGSQRSWWHRWKPAWNIRWQGSLLKLNFDLHRAGGLWLWVMLFVFAWSSVNFNLREVYVPVMDTLFGMQSDSPTSEAPQEFHNPKKWQTEPGIPWRDAYAIARDKSVAIVGNQGSKRLNEVELRYDPESVRYSYSAQVVAVGQADAAVRSLTITMDANTGSILSVDIPPAVERPLGESITDWLNALHIAAIWGLPYRIFVSFTGLVITVLSITGIYLWLVKRKARMALGRGWGS